ncbi:DUF3618 domain-containing protein [Microbacterium sp. SS28]|uniref:DUF3618 domain-containing protein n=1 Tax=Microbacterium sp. SS28 TaxID=2919948 RepID=UPI001FAAAF17|nr:DUF3618 domain-containing protein [Microbacterium sp. SS28]
MSTTSESPEVIRANIEATRRELGQDVDALADKVTPSKIVDRQAQKVRGAFGAVRDRIMGAAEDAAASVGDAGHSVAHGVEDAGRSVAHKAQGNPLAAGLVAFGAGLLLASLFPASDKERELAAKVEEKAQPLMDEVKDAAREVGENLKEPAQDAVTSVKDTAQSAAQHVADEAASSGEAVADETRRSAARAQSEMGTTGSPTL